MFYEMLKTIVENITFNWLKSLSSIKYHFQNRRPSKTNTLCTTQHNMYFPVIMGTRLLSKLCDVFLKVNTNFSALSESLLTILLFYLGRKYIAQYSLHSISNHYSTFQWNVYLRHKLESTC